MTLYFGGSAFVAFGKLVPAAGAGAGAGAELVGAFGMATEAFFFCSIFALSSSAWIAAEGLPYSPLVQL